MGKRFLFTALTFVICCNATWGWSLREKMILRSLPETYSDHQGGLVSEITDQDVSEAINLGKLAKENEDLLLYAHLFKYKTVYVTIRSPLALIAEHSQSAAREFLAVSPEKVGFLRGLGAVQISVTQQKLISVNQVSVARRELILLRDGVRVMPLAEIPSWNGGNVFPAGDLYSDIYAKTNAQIEEVAAASMRTSAAMLDDVGKRAMLAQMRTMGWSSTKIEQNIGWSLDEQKRLGGELTDPVEVKGTQMVSLSDSDNVFEMAQLQKPGLYEIVIREPKIGMFGGYSTKEVRFEISFGSYR